MVSDLQILWGCILYDALKITNNKRNLTDEEIREALTENKGKILKIKELDISCIPIKSLVAEIALFESLEVLNLSNCQLEKISVSLTSLKSLKAVNFKSNKLDDLGEIATNFGSHSLQSIDLSDNAFSVLPESFIDKFDAVNKSLPLHVNLSGNIWIDEDETLKNLSIKNNWVIQLGDIFF